MHVTGLPLATYFPTSGRAATLFRKALGDMTALRMSTTSGTPPTFCISLLPLCPLEATSC